MENQKKLIIILGIIIVILAIIMIYKIKNPKEIKQTSITTNNYSVQNTTVTKERNEVYIVNHKGEIPNITGIVKNGTNQTIRNVKITVDLYDINGNKTGTSGDILDSLAPNETWAFSIYASFSQYKYKNLKVTYENI